MLVGADVAVESAVNVVIAAAEEVESVVTTWAVELTERDMYQYSLPYQIPILNGKR